MSKRNKAVVRRLVEEVLNQGRLEAIDELYAPQLAAAAKAWIAPFRASFPDVQMEIIDLIAEGDTVVGRFTCSATHLGEWLGYAPTGRRFEAVDEVGLYRIRDGRIVESWGLEDTLSRLQQLGLRCENQEPTGGAAMTKHDANIDTSLAVACSLDEQELAQRGQDVARDLFAFAEEIEELPDGYAWRFPGDANWQAKLLAFVEAERRCCGFFRIELAYEPGLGPVTLSLRGPDGTKPFIAKTFVAAR